MVIKANCNMMMMMMMRELTFPMYSTIYTYISLGFMTLKWTQKIVNERKCQGRSIDLFIILFYEPLQTFVSQNLMLLKIYTYIQ